MEIKGYDEYLTDDHEKFICDKCENRVAYVDDLTEVSGGKMVCNDCLEEYFECNECHQYHHVDEVSIVDEVCEDCFNEYYHQCPICLTNFNVEKSKHYNEVSNHLCDKCYVDLEHLL